MGDSERRSARARKPIKYVDLDGDDGGASNSEDDFVDTRKSRDPSSGSPADSKRKNARDRRFERDLQAVLEMSKSEAAPGAHVTDVAADSAPMEVDSVVAAVGDADPVDEPVAVEAPAASPRRAAGGAKKGASPKGRGRGKAAPRKRKMSESEESAGDSGSDFDGGAASPPSDEESDDAFGESDPSDSPKKKKGRGASKGSSAAKGAKSPAPAPKRAKKGAAGTDAPAPKSVGRGRGKAAAAAATTGAAAAAGTPSAAPRAIAAAGPARSMGMARPTAVAPSPKPMPAGASTGLGGVRISGGGAPIRVGLSRNMRVKPLHGYLKTGAS